MKNNSSQTNSIFARLSLWLIAGIITLASLAGNLYWLRENVVLVGRDSGGHLERTLKVAHILSEFSIQSLFQAITFHDYRPPLLYMATQPFYWLGGHSMDSAVLLNVTLSIAILWLTLLLGRRVTSGGTALFAMLLTALLPMIPAMARLFYMESLLTTMLLLNLLALLYSNGFTKRAWAIWWGITLGLALLVKWTAPIYILLPVAYVLWKQPKPTEQPLDPQAQRHTSTFVIAFIGALILTLCWYWPNRIFMNEFLLGHMLPILWLALVALLLYYWMQPQVNSWVNLRLAILMALTLASLWYLPRIDFLSRLTDVAFGTDRGNQETVNLFRLTNYTRYFQFWIAEHMGLLPTLLILPAAVWIGIQRSREHGWRIWQWLRQEMLLLWLMLASAYLFLMLLAQANPRNLVPLIPIIAILLAHALSQYAKPIARTLGILWVAVLALQWSIYTFDGMEQFYQKSAVLWVSGDYHAWPSTGSTDPGYRIQPDVLSTIQIPENQPASFGMLVDMWEIHRGSFRYLIAADKLDIELQTLTEPEGKGWSDMLSNQWILIKKGDNSGVREPGLSVANRILDGDPLFHLLYQEVKQYPLPNDETVYLYHRAAGPAHPHELPVVLIETSVIAEHINAWWSADSTLYLSNADLATWVGIHDLAADQIRMPQTDEDTLKNLLGDVQGKILTATRYDTAQVQDWLHSNSDYVTEVGDGEFKLTLFNRPTKLLQPLPVEDHWAEVQVTELQSYAQLSLGEVLPIEAEFSGQIDGSLKISFRLVNPTGEVMSQRDEILQDKVKTNLFLPSRALDGIPSEVGEYGLQAVIYDPQTLAPILSIDENQAVDLEKIIVVSD